MQQDPSHLSSRLRVRPPMTTTIHEGLLGGLLYGQFVEARTLPRDGETIMNVMRDEVRAQWPSR